MYTQYANTLLGADLLCRSVTIQSSQGVQIFPPAVQPRRTGISPQTKLKRGFTTTCLGQIIISLLKNNLFDQNWILSGFAGKMYRGTGSNYPIEKGCCAFVPGLKGLGRDLPPAVQPRRNADFTTDCKGSHRYKKLGN